jgi:hypothetical protein
VTSQLTPRNKVSGYVDYQKICEGSSYAKDADQCRPRGDDWIGVGGFGTWSPEATHSRDNSEHIMQFVYTSPVTNKLLLEAAPRSSSATGVARRRPAHSPTPRSSR